MQFTLVCACERICVGVHSPYFLHGSFYTDKGGPCLVSVWGGGPPESCLRGSWTPPRDVLPITLLQAPSWLPCVGVRVSCLVLRICKGSGCLVSSVFRLATRQLLFYLDNVLGVPGTNLCTCAMRVDQGTCFKHAKLAMARTANCVLTDNAILWQRQDN